MIATRDPVVVDSQKTQVALEIPPDLEKLEVSISKPGAPDGEGLLGRWLFTGPPGGENLLVIEWPPGGTGPVGVTLGGASPDTAPAFAHEGATVRPDLLLRLDDGRRSWSLLLKVTETGLLRGYYRGESHQDEYRAEHIFFDAFHRGRVRALRRLFEKYIPRGSRVLDVGSGYSMFYMISADWDLEITCCDLDTAAMEKMRSLVPAWNWVEADAVNLPWDDESFDVVYAGEIIEHVADPGEALSEWRRVLSPGGLLIISTPNRDRLLARANRKPTPVHHEHISEMNVREIREALGSHGFEMIKLTAVYLEFLINWWRPPGRRVDLLTARFNRPGYRRVYDAAMEMGRLVPGLAFDLMVVCKKS